MSNMDDQYRKEWKDGIQSKCPASVHQDKTLYDGTGRCCFPQGRYTDCCYENCPIDNSDLADLRAQLAKVTEERDELICAPSEIRVQLMTENADLRTELKAKDERIAELEVELARAREKYTDLGRENNGLYEEIDRLRAKYEPDGKWVPQSSTEGGEG